MEKTNTMKKMVSIIHTKIITIARQHHGSNSNNVHSDADHLFVAHSATVHIRVSEINRRECPCLTPRHDLIFLNFRIKWHNCVMLVVNTSTKSKIYKHLCANRLTVHLLTTNVKNFVSVWVRLMHCAKASVIFVLRRTSRLLKFENSAMKLVISFVYYKPSLVDLTTWKTLIKHSILWWKRWRQVVVAYVLKSGRWSVYISLSRQNRYYYNCNLWQKRYNRQGRSRCYCSNSIVRYMSESVRLIVNTKSSFKVVKAKIKKFVRVMRSGQVCTKSVMTCEFKSGNWIAKWMIFGQIIIKRLENEIGDVMMLVLSITKKCKPNETRDVKRRLRHKMLSSYSVKFNELVSGKILLRLRLVRVKRLYAICTIKS